MSLLVFIFSIVVVMVLIAVTATTSLYVVCCHFIGLTCTAVCHCFKADACQTVPLQGLSTVS